MEELQFYDLVKKKKFKTGKYEHKVRAGRRFAVTKDSPSGKRMLEDFGKVKVK